MPRFRFSLRSLMVVIALCALFLAPAIWFIRQNEHLRRERLMAIRAEQMARAEAERARFLAQVRLAEATLKEATTTPPDRPELALAASPTRGGLWAALSVNHSVVRIGETQDLNIEFTLVNDGDQVLDPKIGDSTIIINGKELEDFRLVLSNGPRDPRFEALPPRDHLRFGYALGNHFQKPGVYRVSWQGANFKAPEVVFRVLIDSGDSEP